MMDTWCPIIKLYQIILGGCTQEGRNVMTKLIKSNFTIWFIFTMVHDVFQLSLWKQVFSFREFSKFVTRPAACWSVVTSQQGRDFQEALVFYRFLANEFITSWNSTLLFILHTFTISMSMYATAHLTTVAQLLMQRTGNEITRKSCEYWWIASQQPKRQRTRRPHFLSFILSSQRSSTDIWTCW